jgi:YgiT-type zinc finger domain-containing protein
MNMSEKLQIKTCPTCGSEKIKRVVRDVVRKYKDQSYSVPAVEFFECPTCGVKVYDREAIQKIEAYSPAYHKSHVVIRNKLRSKTTRAIDTRPPSG